MNCSLSSLQSIWKVIVGLTGIVSILVYILETYFENVISSSVEVVWVALIATFFIIFLSDYVLDIVSNRDNITRYVCSFIGISNLLSLVPVVTLSSNELIWIGFFYLCRLPSIFLIIQLRRSLTFRSQRFENLPVFKVDEVSYQVSKLVLAISMFLLLSSGIVWSLSFSDPEAYYHSFSVDKFNPSLTWFDSLYFVVVTVTTVGYGDISPVSVAAKVITVLIIITGFSLVPVQISALIQAIRERPQYDGVFKSNKDQSHVCLLGIVDFELLERFLTELFHSNHTSRKKSIQLVVAILSPIPPSGPVLQILKLPQFRERVRYFVGTGKSYLDLSRIELENAVAVYVVADEITDCLRTEDDSIFLTSLSVLKYLQQNLNVSSGIIRRKPLLITKLASSTRSKDILLHSGFDVVLGVQEFKVSLLSLGMVFPGFLALFQTINRARSPLQWTQTRQQSILKELPEFYDSTRYCIHELLCREIDVLQNILNMNFASAVEFIYQKSIGTVILLGFCQEESGQVIINPAKASEITIQDCESIFVLSTSFDEAKQAFTVNLWHQNRRGRGSFTDLGEGIDEESTSSFVYVNQPASVHEANTIGQLQRSQGSAPSAATNRKSRVKNGNPDKLPIRLCFANRKVSFHRLSSLGPIILPSERYETEQLGFNRMPSVNTAKEKNPFRERFRPISASASEPNVCKHSVLILCTDENDSYKIHKLLSPIISFLIVYRKYSNEKLVILSSYDMSEATLEATLMRPDIFDNVHFVHGLPRSVHHLELCGVQRARAITIMKLPAPVGKFLNANPKDQFLTPSEILRHPTVDIDRNTIIVYANLQMLLKQSQYMPVDLSRFDTLHYHTLASTVVEVVREANISFLRQPIPFTRGDGDRSTSSRYSNDPGIFDWCAVASGSVLIHSTLDSLIVQTIFNPRILKFWESFGVSPSSLGHEKRQTVAHISPKHGKKSRKLTRDLIKRFCIKKSASWSHRFRLSLPKASKLVALGKVDGATIDFHNHLKSMSGYGCYHNISSRKHQRVLRNTILKRRSKPRTTVENLNMGIRQFQCLDKIQVPAEFIGWLFRWHHAGAAHAAKLLPYVVVSPDPTTLLNSCDEIFILRSTLDSFCDLTVAPVDNFA